MLIFKVLYFANLLASFSYNRTSDLECYSNKTATITFYSFCSLSNTPIPLSSISIYCDYRSKHHLTPNFCIPKQLSLFALCTLLLLSGDIATNPGPGINSGLCNIRSLKKNYTASTDFITSKGINILSVTETWLTNGDTESQLAEVTPLGFTLLHNPRIGRAGGGVGFLVQKTFNVSQVKGATISKF